ncbi:DsbE family thiol:disulfide interchange protein [Brevundimonas aveniformis]|uniref:DsbE family thiol:disulfide interchange protein n=1 Tax=Brevundimonas aveniformis TaxID=370977 RepID=UPI00248F7263|nr:DsbE family thiol:disulfide interchange protein [Brevundimonas aveniformis]
MIRRLLFFVPVVALAVLAGLLWLGLGRDPEALPSTLIDRPLPAFELAPVRTGEDHGLATTDFTGRPMLLNVFASWCVGCRVEHPFLMELAGRGVVIQGLDWKDPPGAGAAWLAEHGDPYARVGDDPDGRTGIDLGVSGAPETFIVDARGRVRHRHVGPITPEVWETELRPILQRLEAEG